MYVRMYVMQRPWWGRPHPGDAALVLRSRTGELTPWSWRASSDCLKYGLLRTASPSAFPQVA